MNKQTSRRDIITHAAGASLAVAAAAATIAPSAASERPDDPIYELDAERLRLESLVVPADEALIAARHADSPDVDALEAAYESASDATVDITWEIVDTPAASIGGVIRKLKLAAEWFGGIENGDDPADALFASALTDLERLTAEARR